jgi:hypothetical protein
MHERPVHFPDDEYIPPYICMIYNYIAMAACAWHASKGISYYATVVCRCSRLAYNQIHQYSATSLGQLVHPPAVAPDLRPAAPCQDTNAAHLHHGRREVALELCRAGRVAPDQAVRRAAAEQLLVRVQQPALRDQVAVVPVVERVRRGRVQRRERAAATSGRRAAGPPRRREGRVNVALVVDPGPEVLALRLPHRVGTCMHARQCSVRVSYYSSSRSVRRIGAVAFGGTGNLLLISCVVMSSVTVTMPCQHTVPAHAWAVATGDAPDELVLAGDALIGAGKRRT